MSQQAEVFTIGVEEEYQIIDPLTRELSQDAERMLPKAQEKLGGGVQLEQLLSQIEVATPVCRTLTDVQTELSRLRHGMIEVAGQMGRHIAAAGTHPFSPWQRQQVTPAARYEQLVRQYQQLISQQVIYGCHVHVGLSDRERAVMVMNRARVWLPLLLALTATSPFWMGADTEYASFRTGLWWTSPLSGPPPLFASWAEYDGLVQTLVATKALEDATRIYWDIRLPERFPTIEFRVMDVCTTLDETIMIAGLVRALVRTCYEQAIREEPFPAVPTELLRAANWRAARYGLDAGLIDFETERVIPAHEVMEKFLAGVRPALEAEGDWDRISVSLRQLMQRGNGATRQREVYKRAGRMEDVVDFLVAETAKGVDQIRRKELQ